MPQAVVAAVATKRSELARGLRFLLLGPVLVAPHIRPDEVV
jgi:hypothetical protein